MWYTMKASASVTATSMAACSAMGTPPTPRRRLASRSPEFSSVPYIAPPLRRRERLRLNTHKMCFLSILSGGRSLRTSRVLNVRVCPRRNNSRASQAHARPATAKGPTSLRFSRSRRAHRGRRRAPPVAASLRPDVLGSPAGRKSNDPSHFPLCWHPRRAREKPRWSPRPPLRAR